MGQPIHVHDKTIMQVRQTQVNWNNTIILTVRNISQKPFKMNLLPIKVNITLCTKLQKM